MERVDHKREKCWTFVSKMTQYDIVEVAIIRSLGQRRGVKLDALARGPDGDPNRPGDLFQP
jgi:hypothetical protein